MPYKQSDTFTWIDRVGVKFRSALTISHLIYKLYYVLSYFMKLKRETYLLLNKFRPQDVPPDLSLHVDNIIDGQGQWRLVLKITRVRHGKIYDVITI